MYAVYVQLVVCIMVTNTTPSKNSQCAETWLSSHPKGERFNISLRHSKGPWMQE